jgi:hypothetical protein
LAVRFLVVLLAVSLLAAPSDRYQSVTINADGSVTVATEDGRHITPQPLAPVSGYIKNVGAEQAAVAPDHQSVGWLALFENGGTSYPLPLRLVIFYNGRLRALEGKAYDSIWFWRFQNGGKRVAAREELPHSGFLHYDVWDVASGKRVADYTPKYDQYGGTIARPNEPEWVKALDAAEAKSR